MNTNLKDVRIVASGHRVVHGGERYTTPTLVDAKTLDYLDGLSALEPSHQPAEVGGIRAITTFFRTFRSPRCLSWTPDLGPLAKV